MKFRLRVRLKSWNDQGEFDLDRAKSKINIAENSFALGHETRNNTQVIYLPLTCRSRRQCNMQTVQPLIRRRVIMRLTLIKTVWNSDHNLTNCERLWSTLRITADGAFSRCHFIGRMKIKVLISTYQSNVFVYRALVWTHHVVYLSSTSQPSYRQLTVQSRRSI